MPKRFTIPPDGIRVAAAIAEAAGIRSAGYETFVTLRRGDRKTTLLFDVLVQHPEEDIYVLPGDVIYVYREQRKFVALGATVSSNVNLSAQTAEFAFEQPSLSLNEAVARAGGLLDSRADAAQVFLYRMENRALLEAVGVDLANFPQQQVVIPTIYHANFRNPEAFFMAQSFPMRNKDIIYVSNAEAVEVSKFLTYVNGITSTVSGVTADAALTRSSGKYLFTGKN